MEISNSADIFEDSGLVPLLNEMTIKDYFKDKDYGNKEVKLFFVINCLKLNVKNRVRLSAKDKVLYWDVILDYKMVKKASIQEKKKAMANSIINSFDILDKYKKLNFDKDKIKGDARKYFELLRWL